MSLIGRHRQDQDSTNRSRSVAARIRGELVIKWPSLDKTGEVEVTQDRVFTVRWSARREIVGKAGSGHAGQTAGRGRARWR